MNFIGDLGGTSEFMLQLAGWILGSYSAFHASIATMSALYFYRVKNSDKIFLDRKQNNGDAPEIQKIKLPLLTRLFLWTQTTMFSFLCKSCRSE
jgi:hypothetical protein